MLRLKTFEFSELLAAHGVRNAAHQFSLTQMMQLDDAILTPEDAKEIDDTDSPAVSTGSANDNTAIDNVPPVVVQSSRNEKVVTIVSEPRDERVRRPVDYDMLLTQPQTEDPEFFSQLDEMLLPAGTEVVVDSQVENLAASDSQIIRDAILPPSPHGANVNRWASAVVTAAAAAFPAERLLSPPTVSESTSSKESSANGNKTVATDQTVVERVDLGYLTGIGKILDVT
jgi:hypothetical protein